MLPSGRIGYDNDRFTVLLHTYCEQVSSRSLRFSVPPRNTPDVFPAFYRNIPYVKVFFYYHRALPISYPGWTTAEPGYNLGRNVAYQAFQTRDATAVSGRKLNLRWGKVWENIVTRFTCDPLFHPDYFLTSFCPLLFKFKTGKNNWELKSKMYHEVNQSVSDLLSCKQRSKISCLTPTKRLWTQNWLISPRFASSASSAPKNRKRLRVAMLVAYIARIGLG